MKALLQFELANYAKRMVFYAILFSLIGFGIIIGYKFSMQPSANIFKNSAYAIAQMTGLMSLMSIFFTTILATQLLFKEQDANFTLLLYSTPINKKNYLLSRFLAVFLLSFFMLFCLFFGYAIGQQIAPNREYYIIFNGFYYLNPLLIFGLFNTFFCSALVCSVAWLSKNKLFVYIAGLFIYILYMVMLLFSGSPMMAGTLPPSPEAMDFSAKIDPFGISAFFHQTRNWSVIQRNTQVLSLTGNLLINRLGFGLFSVAILTFAMRKFSFSVNEKRKLQITPPPAPPLLGGVYRRNYVSPLPEGEGQGVGLPLLSFIKLDLTFVIKSIPFVLVALLLIFAISMELYGDIGQGIRLPEHYASSGLIVRTIISTFHGLFLIVLLFYAHELIWRSQVSNFAIIENATPVNEAIRFFAKWLSLSIIILIFSSLTIILGIIFQLIYAYPHIELDVYASIYLFNSLPLIMSAGVILVVQKLVNSRYVGLVISSLLIFLTATKLSKMIGITHPLFLFQTAFSGRYSDFNGWGNYLETFSCKMLFGMSLVLLVALLIHVKKITSFRKDVIFKISLLLFTTTLFSGFYIAKNYKTVNSNTELDKQQNYELQYRKFQHLPQPTVTDVKTEINLFPEQNTYQVQGFYTIQNKTQKPITQILVNFDEDLQLEKAELLTKNESKTLTNHIEIIKLTTALQANEIATFSFSFTYSWNGFNKHQSFNAILNNGSFMRISRYFPVFGYQADNEIAEKVEREKRNLGKATQIVALEASKETQDDLINLDMTISTNSTQTAIGVGELVKNWQSNNRNYFQYKTTAKIPFRFGLSSAEYTVQKTTYQGKNIEIYYHFSHFENVAHLIENAKKTLDYCQTNFGNYPYSTIRFAEISSFTQGFAATAYPATIFMPENVIFHANIKADKQQDVINELAGHEFSHQWWGNNAQINPANREGAAMLTETLAMYTELMLVKKMYGQKRLLELVEMHTDIYLKERGFGDEQPLYKTHSENAHQHYSKGAVVMYQLSEKIGEEKVNLALRNFLQKYKQTKTALITTDFLEELYAITDSLTHSKIDDFFKRITVYDLKVDKVAMQKVGLQYKISFELLANKYYEDGKGKATATAFDDYVEIGFEMENGELIIRQIPVNQLNSPTKITLNSKVISLMIEPNKRFICLGNGFRVKL